ncbi:MAG TPA: hypothetical protein DF715_15550 [Oceanicaulis sp.]|uniref:Uncharacterized protein n=1 Tax=Glycocaulis albus TaxID=1382801 RepID=A0ABQ1XYI1_9PROT|nr:hypothetical protein GCM10007420_24740 [Glycocaulis albus]HCY56860.1 hypothetical protein [Oceanicaulis sp.]
MMSFSVLFAATGLLSAPLAIAGSDPGAVETVTSAQAAAPYVFEGGTALRFAVQRSLSPRHGEDCEEIIGDAPPGAELVISGEQATLNGIIITMGEGFSRLVFEDPSGRVTCLAGGGEPVADGTPVGGYQTLLDRPFGTWRFWVAASAPGPFDVHIEFE